MNADFQRIVNAGGHSIAFYLDEVAEKLEDHMDKLSKVRLPAEGDEEKLASLRRICSLPGDYEVYPGHMDSTTLERERMFNYYCRTAMQG